MVVDLTAKKQAREARLQAKREAIQAQQGDVATPATTEPEVKDKK